MALRVAFLALVLLPFTLVGMPLQWVIVRFGLPGAQCLPAVFFKLAAFGLGLRVTLEGHEIAKGRTLLVANHIGWLDIVALASAIPVSFVAKSEVSGWPLVGTLARLHRTIFVDRQRRTATRRTAEAIGDRIAQGCPVLLFAEGTSGPGTHVLPFRSALMGAASATLAPAARIQPLAIAYTKISGLPLSGAQRRQFAWIGDMEMRDTLGAILSSGPKTVIIAVGKPFPADADRKQMAKKTRAQVRLMLNALNRGLPLPKDGEVV
ncbi:lysophospholipid acyltransferase family protein [Pelagibacterium sp.]|uniref:lysophospholipid acyltransferase family protein n=1 Tax=Pelagibacterium sp. TaxID=1967288 RepID=UPI003A95D6A1